MRKFGIFTTTLFISILLAGIYGILHDQITYTISPEYFTKFKYRQFSFEPSLFGGHRQTVAVIGFLATWWVGLWIGLIIGFLRGRYHLTKTGVSWWLPEDLINRDDFITVGAIHNYSYLGGAIGLLLAIIYMISKNILAKRKQAAV